MARNTLKEGQHIIVKRYNGTVVRGIVQKIEGNLLVLEPKAGREHGTVIDISENSNEMIANKILLEGKTKKELSQELRVPVWAISAVLNGSLKDYGHAPIKHMYCDKVRIHIARLFNMPLKDIFDLESMHSWMIYVTPENNFNELNAMKECSERRQAREAEFERQQALIEAEFALRRQNEAEALMKRATDIFK